MNETIFDSFQGIDSNPVFQGKQVSDFTIRFSHSEEMTTGYRQLSKMMRVTRATVYLNDVLVIPHPSDFAGWASDLGEDVEDYVIGNARQQVVNAIREFIRRANNLIDQDQLAEVFQEE